MNGKKRIPRRLGITVAVLAALLALWILVGNLCIVTRCYTVRLDNMHTPVHAVLVSDLHGRSFGRGNARLIAKIRAQAPDAIFLTGDMLDSDADTQDVARFLQLVSNLCEIAPVYFSLGNHEQSYMQTDATLLDQVAGAGAVVVNDSYVDVTLAGQPLRIGGTLGHGFYFGRSEEEFTSSAEYQFLTAFEDTDALTICLAHMPDTFIFNGAYNYWDVDLALSGHTHGGLIRLPFMGGLYAPMQEWFPEYDMGWFRLGDHMQMVITSGLAGHDFIPRINNPPEIVVLDLVPET